MSLFLALQLIMSSSGSVLLVLADEVSQEQDSVAAPEEPVVAEVVPAAAETAQEVPEETSDDEATEEVVQEEQPAEEHEEGQEAQEEEVQEDADESAVSEDTEEDAFPEEVQASESTEAQEEGEVTGVNDDQSEERDEDAQEEEGEGVEAESEETGAEEELEEEEVSQEDGDVQLDQNDQTVQDIVQPVQKSKEELLELLNTAFANGSLKRSLPEQIRQYLVNEQVSQELIDEILERFPGVSEEDRSEKSLKTDKAVIPAYLLQGARKANVAAGISTQDAFTTPLQQEPVEFVSERILVKVRSRAVAEQWITAATAEGMSITILLDNDQPLLRVDANGTASTVELLQRYHQHPDVIYQEPDYIYTVDAVPNDSLYATYAWQHNNTGGSYGGFSGSAGEDIQSQDAWDIFTGDGSVIIAVIDTGVMLNHPDLQNNLWDGSAGCVDQNNVAIAGGCPYNGYDFFDADNNPSDESNHGTLVAGSAAAQGNNATGVTGTNWSGKIMALKAGTANSNKLSESAIVSSINFAVNNGAKILNLSFSSSAQSTYISDALDTARTNGVLVFASAGNNDQDLDVQSAYPCETPLDNIICIAATNVQGTLDFLVNGVGPVGGSNYGQTTVDIAAPGTSIPTTAPQHTDLYTNNFSNGSTDVADFTTTGSEWGLKSGGNNLLTTHVSGVYGNNESTTATLNQSFDLSPYPSGTLFFEMSCSTDNTVDASNAPVDGVAVEFSTNGGSTYQEVASFNGDLTTEKGDFDMGPNGLPLITIGLLDTELVSGFTFRFRFFSDGSLTGAGCDIDEIILRVNSSSKYVLTSGTSFAAPITAGLASLIWEFDPTLTYTQVRDNIYAGGESLPALTSTTITGKRINAYRSLALLADPAVVNLRGFLSNGGTEIADSDVIPTDSPYFSWTAPTGQGILTGYSFAVDGVPDATVDTTALNATLSGLAEGAHSFQVFGVNDVGTTGTVAVFNFTVDTIAPDAVTGLNLNTNDFVNAGNASATTLNGTAAEAATLSYTISDGNNTDITGTEAVGAGAFSVTGLDLSSLDDGSLTVAVTLTDLAGNVSSAANTTVNKDVVIPIVSNLQLNGNTPVNIASGNTVDLTFDTTESGSANYTIFNGIDTAVTGTEVIMGADTTIVSVDLSGLSDATLDISVTFTDDAGNLATSVTGTLVKDTEIVAPANIQINGFNIISNHNLSGSELRADLTEDGTLDYSISDSVNPILTGSTPSIPSTDIQAINIFPNASTLNDGSLTFTITLTDLAGNVSAVTMQNVWKDTVPPPLPTAVNVNGNNIINSDNETSSLISGDASEEGLLRLFYTDINGDLKNIQRNTGGTGPFTETGIDFSQVPEGQQTFTIDFVDNSGNYSTSDISLNIEKDTVLPSEPSSILLNGGVTINAATQTSVTLTGVASDTGTLEYYIAGPVNDVLDAVPVSAGPFTIPGIDVSTLSDGPLEVIVDLTDLAGNNFFDSNSDIFQKDTAVSAVTTVQLNAGADVNAGNVTSSSLNFDASETGSATYSISDGVNPAVTGSVTVTTVGTTTVSSLDLSSLNEGSLSVSVTFTDDAGNTAAAGTGTAQKDTQVSAATNVQLNAGSVVNGVSHTSVDLTFDTTESGSATYSISDGVNPAVSGTVSVTGSGTTTVTALDVSALNNGTLNLSVVFTDDAGNTAVAGTGSVQKDAQAPDAPTGVSLNGGVVINAANQNSVSITGTVAEAGTLLYSIIDGVNPAVSGSQAVASGAFSVTGLDVSALKEGTLTVYVTLTDASGNTSTDGNDTETKDTQVSAAGTVALNGGSIVVAANHNSVALTFTTTESGSVSYTISDGVNAAVTGTVPVTGAGTTTVAALDVSALNDGTLNLSVVFTDDAGNTAAAGTGSVQKDASVSPATNVDLNAGVTIIATTQGSVSLTFDTDESGTAAYTISDGVNPDLTGSTVVAGAGTTTVSGIDVSALNDGTLNLSVTFTDTAGNTSAAGTGAVQKDAIVTAATNVQLNGNAVINAANQGSVDLTFDTAEAGSASYSISDGVNAALTGTVAVTGAGTTTVAGFDVSGLNDGTLNLSVTFTDSPGNVAATGAGSVPKDTQVSVATNVQVNGGSAVNAGNQTSVVLTFDTAESGTATYTISDGVNGDITGSVTVTGAGTTSVNGLNISSLNDGTINLSVIFTDDAGNTAGAGAGTAQKDTGVPNAPAGVQLNGGVAITGASAGSVDLTGTVDEAGTISYSISDGVNPPLAGTQAVGVGGFTVSSLDVTSLNDGTLNISVTNTDAAGNVSAVGTATLQKDAIAPDAPTGVTLNGASPINAANQSAVTISGSVAEAGTLLYSIIDGVNPAVAGSQAVASGAFSVTGLDVSGLDDGTLTVYVTLTDAVGNTSTDGNDTETKDTQITATTNAQLNAGVTINASSQTAVELRFDTTESGSVSYTISDGVNADVTGTTAVAGSGTTTVSGIDVSSLNDGSLNFSVVFTDDVGNVASAATGSVQKDVAVTPAANVQLNGGSGIAEVAQTSVDLTFDVTEAGSASYSISDGASPDVTGVQAVVAGGTITVSGLDVSSLNDGTLSISVVFTDSAGNVAAAGTATVLKDTVAQAPTNLVLNNNQIINLALQSLVTFRATAAETGTFNFIFSDGVNPDVTGSQAVTTANVVTVSNIDLSTLNEGSLNFSVSLTDDLGNVSTALTGTASKDTIVSSAASVVFNSNTPITGNSASSVTLAFVADEEGSVTYVITDEQNNTVTDTIVVTSSGTITISNIDVSALADGLLTPEIIFTDSSGNVAGSTLGTAVVKDSTLTSVPATGGRRRSSTLDQNSGGTPVATPVATVTPAPSGGGGGGGGGGSFSGGAVLGATTEDTAKQPSENEEEVVVLPFRDVRESDEYYQAVLELYTREIVKGQNNTNRFDPRGVLDRAQALKMLLMLADIEIPASVLESPFLDVEASAWFAPIIAMAKQMGFVQGYADGNFIPWRVLNRAEAIVMAYRILGVEVAFDGVSEFADVEADVWFAAVLHDAVERGLLEVREDNGQTFADPTADMTRAEFAILIVGLLE